jgi:putative FmdB family regulatory protein
MEYDYKCNKCGHEFSLNLPIAHRDAPTKQACPECGEKGMVVRTIVSAPISYKGAKSLSQRTPDGFKEVMRKIKKSSGKGCTIDV